MLRHGETDWNAQHRWQGWTDIALNDIGRKQAKSRAIELASGPETFTSIFTSDLARASETADILSAALQISHRFEDPGFRERFGGDWQGLTSDEINEQYPHALEEFRSGILAGPPNAESVDSMLQRFDNALERAHQVLPDANTILVTHGGILRAVSVRAGLTFEGVHANLTGNRFVYDNGTLTVDVASEGALPNEAGMYSTASCDVE